MRNEFYSKIGQLCGNRFNELRPKIESFLEEGRTEIEVYNIISRYIAVEPYCRTLDFDNGDYIDFVKSVNMGTFLKSKFNEQDKIAIMNKTMVYEDDCICIFRPTSFEESVAVGDPICCFSYSQGRWDEHYNVYNEAIYFVYDVMRELTPQMFVAITVRPSGRALVLDCEHEWLTPSESLRFIQGLGNGMNVIKTKENKSIKTESINMNKTKIILTESQLHSMIKECVKSILSEGSKIQNRVPYPLADEYHFDDNNNLQFKPKDPYADEYTSLEAKNKRNIRHQQRYNKNNMRLWFDFTLNDQSLQANLDYLRQGDDFWLKEGEGLGVLQWEYFDPTKSNAKRISVNNLVELWNIDGMYFFLVRKDKEKEFEN